MAESDSGGRYTAHAQAVEHGRGNRTRVRPEDVRGRPGPRGRSRRAAFVSMMQAAENRERDDLAHTWRPHGSRDRRVLAEREVRSHRVVIALQVLAEDPPEVPLVQHDHVVEAVPA